MKERLNILYQNGQNGLTPAVSASGLLNAVARKWITIEDAVEIIGTDKSAEVIRAAKVAEISAACNAVIVSGIDLELADGPVHFNLSIEDQSNIANLFRVVELGGTEFPYQADGGVCRIYNAQEAYVQGLDDVEQIAAVQYGMTLPDPYASEVAEKLSVAQTQMNAIVARLGGNA